MRSWTRTFVAFACLVLWCAWTSTAAGQPPTAESATGNAVDKAHKQEARERFDQGLKLFNEGDNAGALAEFERAYEISPNVTVLFNIGLVYVAMNRPVDAVEAFDEVLGEPEELGANDVKEATRIRNEQMRRVATVVVVVKQSGAVVEVDGKRVGKTPLEGPVKVAGGTHRVTVSAAGRHPFREEITVAGGTRRELVVELLPVETARTRLSVQSPLPGATVRIDGRPRGQTPLSAPLVLEPGAHEISLEREGYVRVSKTLTLDEGAIGEITLTPTIDYAALARSHGTLVVDTRDTAVVAIDGVVYPAGTLEFALPPGQHRVGLELAGYLPAAQSVAVQPQATTTLEFDLVATSATVTAHRRRVRRRRIWGASVGGAGVVTATVGALYLARNAKNIDAAESRYDEVVWEAEPHTGRRCDVFDPDFNRDQCAADLDTYYERLEDERARTKWGYALVGSGGALAIGGAILVATAGDPDRYEKVAQRRLRLASGPGELGLSLRGEF